MRGRRHATLAAALTGTAALALVPTWTDAARTQHGDRANHKRVARNVIVLQGDGMGTAQRNLIRLVTVGNKEGQDLAMNRLDHGGLVHTDPADPEEAVTDSAAAATAFSTGVKTFNGAIGVDAERQARSRRCSRTRAAPARRPGSSPPRRSPTRRPPPTPRTSATAPSRARSPGSSSRTPSRT